MRGVGVAVPEAGDEARPGDSEAAWLGTVTCAFETMAAIAAGDAARARELLLPGKWNLLLGQALVLAWRCCPSGEVTDHDNDDHGAASDSYDDDSCDVGDEMLQRLCDAVRALASADSGRAGAWLCAGLGPSLGEAFALMQQPQSPHGGVDFNLRGRGNTEGVSGEALTRLCAVRVSATLCSLAGTDAGAAGLLGLEAAVPLVLHVVRYHLGVRTAGLQGEEGGKEAKGEKDSEEEAEAGGGGEEEEEEEAEEEE
jgi:hypothetical protein